MQIADEDLALLKNGTMAVMARVVKIGKELDPDFREDEVYRQPNDFHTACSVMKSIDNTLGAVERRLSVVKKLRDEIATLTKAKTEAEAFAEEQVAKYERLAKGEIECPGCAGSGKDGDRECRKCDGEKYVSVR